MGPSVETKEMETMDSSDATAFVSPMEVDMPGSILPATQPLPNWAETTRQHDMAKHDGDGQRRPPPGGLPPVVLHQPTKAPPILKSSNADQPNRIPLSRYSRFISTPKSTSVTSSSDVLDPKDCPRGKKPDESANWKEIGRAHV